MSFLEKPHVKFLRFYFLKDFWDFLLNKTSCFTYLKMCKAIAAVYQKFNLSITFNSLGGYFVTSIYTKVPSEQVYRRILPANAHKPVLHTLFLAKGKPKPNVVKQTTALTANFIQSMDAFIIHRLFSRLRDFYIPGIGFPLLTVFDSLTFPTIFYSVVLSIYQEINFDIFSNKGTLQDFRENYSNEFFSDNGKSLLKTYFEHFILDLELQIGNSQDGKVAIYNLKNNLEQFLEDMEKAPDFIPFDYEILKTALFVKKT